MRCEINIYAEKQLPNGTWRRLHVLVPENRDYRAFSIMADVQSREGSGIVPISPPRGLPTDCDYLGDDDDFYLGDHSFSWLWLSELEEYQDKAENCPPLIKKIVRCVSQQVREGDKKLVRVVFGFDS